MGSDQDGARLCTLTLEGLSERNDCLSFQGFNDERAGFGAGDRPDHCLERIETTLR